MPMLTRAQLELLFDANPMGVAPDGEEGFANLTLLVALGLLDRCRDGHYRQTPQGACRARAEMLPAAGDGGARGGTANAAPGQLETT